ncbi:MAG: T9SS type A sorting domain-containing protein [Crocinitomicaceae bacterium]
MKRLLFLLLSMGCLLDSYSQCSGYTLTLDPADVTCYQFCDGSLFASTSGGNGGDSFTITDDMGNTVNSGGVNIANSLCSGWYYVSVVDNMGCVLEDSAYIDQPDELDIDFTLTNLLCFGNDSGSVIIDTVYNFQGSFNQISYFWTPNPNGVNGIGANENLGLTAGNYVLTINDELGCSKTFDFDITQPNELVFNEFGFEPCQGGNEGIVFMAASGGAPDYTYTWTDLNDNSQTGNTVWGGLDYGCYEGLVMDANGCILKDTACVSCLSIDELGIEISIYPNPSQGEFIIQGDTFETVQLDILDVSGKSIYSQNNYGLGEAVNLSDLRQGIYIIAISIADQTDYYRLIKE